MQNKNVLIAGNNIDTIDEIYTQAEWLCLIASEDENIHPGMVQQLRNLTAAIKTLKQPETPQQQAKAS